MRFWMAIFFLTFSSEALAWSPFTHAFMVRESLSPVAKEWKLDQPIPITPFDRFLKKFLQMAPQVKTKKDFADWLKINPDVHIERLTKGEKIGAWTTPLQILINYAPRSDDNRDKHLSYDPMEQFWFGSGVASASQAFRHMEKPPFQILHPLNTFGFPLGKIGQASERAQIYFDLAVLAHHLDEPYWAWNFLGCGLHYIEDLQNPYHTAQLFPPVLIKSFSAYWHWGRKYNRGFISVLTLLTANLHHYFEGYVEWVLKPEKPLDPVMDHKQFWVEALHQFVSKNEFETPSSIRQLAKNIRDFSNQWAYDAVQATLQLTGENLLGTKDYSIGTDQNPFPEEPTPYFTSNGEQKRKAADAIRQMVWTNFQYQGMAVRTVVQSFLNQI